MKKDEVKVGETYRCQVSGETAEVRIVAENPNGGWDAVNVKTKRKVRIKTAQRLRTKAGTATKTKAKAASKDAVAKTEAAPAEKKQSGKKKTAKADRQKRPSGLDAAAQVLADAKEPLATKEMVERMLDKGLWRTGGKTPAATIYAAIIREIAKKGSDARFHKVERGKFQLAK